MKKALITLACALIMGTGFGAGSAAWAFQILPGDDRFQTPNFQSPFLSMGLGMPVFLEGRGFGQGSVDTIVRRLGGLPPGGTGLIPIELVMLDLVSTNIPGLGLRLSPMEGSLGEINILTHVDTPTDGGGTFSSFINVVAELTLFGVPIDCNPNLPDFQLCRLTIRDGSSDWSHRAIDGGFFPGPIDHNGEHPVIPSVPEPSTLVLLGSGLLGLGAVAWRRHRRK